MSTNSDIIQDLYFRPCSPPWTIDRLLLRLFSLRVGLLYEVPGETLTPAHCDDVELVDATNCMNCSSSLLPALIADPFSFAFSFPDIEYPAAAKVVPRVHIASYGEFIRKIVPLG